MNLTSVIVRVLSSIIRLYGLFAFSSGLHAAAPTASDRAINLVDILKYDSLKAMRAAGLEQARLIDRPWSGWYWPLYQGGLATRLADPAYPIKSPVRDIANYFILTLGRVPVSQLSPAEKYDLLVGDSSFTMSRNMMLLAENAVNTGTYDYWMGFCGGWAHASMNLPRPRHSVTVIAADGGTRIEFLPSDIEALASLLWNKGLFRYRMVGSLCFETTITRDPVNDRTMLAECFDTNPATWHVSVVNQLGVAGRSFLIDADPSRQIWNHPVSAYSYRYFNPITDKPVESLEEARVTLKDFEKDPHAATRTPDTSWVVGVEMEAEFVYYKDANGARIDTPDTDQVRKPVYRYDLELDSHGKIIGGEWHSRLHPDVIWVAERGVVPKTKGDALLKGASNWFEGEPLPAEWTKAAVVGSKGLQPLANVIYKLVEWSLSTEKK